MSLFPLLDVIAIKGEESVSGLLLGDIASGQGSVIKGSHVVGIGGGEVVFGLR